MKNLISMTDFVLEEYRNWNANSPTTIINYAQFLKQPLELWMFVPCKLVDGVWEVFEEPNNYKLWEKAFFPKPATLALSAYMDYQQAKERCLFEGFELKINKSTESLSIVDKTGILNVMWKFPLENWKPSAGTSKIEDLVKYNLELTK